jgi:hypothetical protein
MRLVTGSAASSQAQSQPPRPIAGAGDFLLKEEDFPPLPPSAKAAAAQVAIKPPAITPSPPPSTPLPPPLHSGAQVKHWRPSKHDIERIGQIQSRYKLKAETEIIYTFYKCRFFYTHASFLFRIP